MSQVLTLLKRAVKAVLRPLADALLASARSLPARVEACLAESATVAGQVEKHLATSDVLGARIEECLHGSEIVAARVQEYLAESETLVWRIEASLTGAPAVQARIEELVVNSAALPAQVEDQVTQSPALRARLEQCLEQSKTLRERVEQALTSTDVLPRRIEQHVAGWDALAGLIEKHVWHSAALGERLEEYFAAAPALAARVDEHLNSSPILGERIDDVLTSSETLSWRIEQHLTTSEALPTRIEQHLTASEALPARVDQCVLDSPALATRVEESVIASPSLPARVEEYLVTSQALPRRVEECIRDLRVLADRIEECLWASKALPRRIDDYLGGSKALPERIVEECLRRSTVLTQTVTDLLPDNPCLAGVVLPYRGEYPAAVPRVTRSAEEGPAGGALPVPGRELWEGHGPAAADYLASGRAYADRLKDIVQASGPPVAALGRILDFTSGAGHVLRWLADRAPERELWGVDVSAPHVVWLRQHLCPPLRAATRSTAPHLPFEDRTFDLVYSTTPFGRPPDLAEAWLLELRRVLRPGGRLCLAVLDKEAVGRLLESASAREPLLRAALLAEPNRSLVHSDYVSLAVQTPLGVHVLYDRDALCAQWGREMHVVSVTPAAWGPYTAILLERA